MLVKLLMGLSLEDLEKKLGSWFVELENREVLPRKIKIVHVHSFITQEVGKTSTLGSGPQVITKFSLMLIYEFESTVSLKTIQA